ncbi:MAG: hypothetical protein RIB58_14710 [Phycisphaerales bacterium]
MAEELYKCCICGFQHQTPLPKCIGCGKWGTVSRVHQVELPRHDRGRAENKPQKSQPARKASKPNLPGRPTKPGTQEEWTTWRSIITLVAGFGVGGWVLLAMGANEVGGWVVAGIVGLIAAAIASALYKFILFLVIVAVAGTVLWLISPLFAVDDDGGQPAAEVRQ